MFFSFFQPNTDPFDPPKCKAKDYKPAVKVTSWGYAVPRCKSNWAGNCTGWEKHEPALAAVVATRGPVSICMDATGLRKGYQSGSVWRGPPGGCLSDAKRLNHCVQLVGYDLDAKTWLVRNSWGTSFGDKGYFTMEFGSNMCGVADEATIVNVTKA